MILQHENDFLVNKFDIDMASNDIDIANSGENRWIFQYRYMIPSLSNSTQYISCLSTCNSLIFVQNVIKGLIIIQKKLFSIKARNFLSLHNINFVIT